MTRIRRGHGIVLAILPGMDAQVEPVARVAAESWHEVVAWLDAGLRRGDGGRLQAEYPLSLRPESNGDQFLVSEGDRPLSHAMFHRVTARIDHRSLRLGLIGLVYTEESARGRGLAGRCVQACVERLREEGITLAVLWSDRHAFYERLGFHPAGRERFLVLDGGVLKRAEASAGPGPDLDVAAPESGDWRALEHLYEARRYRAERQPGDLARLAAGPEVELRVARQAGRPIAYAALGRGDDFAEVIHEWAGHEHGVLACLRALLPEHRAIGLMASPGDGELIARLEGCGAVLHPRIFALMRLLDPEALWKAARAGSSGLEGVEMARVGDRVCISGSRGEMQISDARALSWLLSDDPDLRSLATALTSEEQAAFESCRPLPLYLWGFDSI